MPGGKPLNARLCGVSHYLSCGLIYFTSSRSYIYLKPNTVIKNMHRKKDCTRRLKRAWPGPHSFLFLCLFVFVSSWIRVLHLCNEFRNPLFLRANPIFAYAKLLLWVSGGRARSRTFHLSSMVHGLHRPLLILFSPLQQKCTPIFVSI